MKDMCQSSPLRAAAALLLGALLLSGCASSPPQRDAAYAAARPVALERPQQHNGAIYQAGYERYLFEDRRARRVGDLLTIVLLESTNASKQASTDIDKSTDTTISNPTLLGSPVQFRTPGFLPLQSNDNNNLGTSLASENEFSGEGSSSQSNSLTGSITVTVAEVLPNGYLYVRGEKLLTLNQGDEHVRIAGIVRPDDIQSDNSVPSTKVGDAQITYAGRGPIADSNAIGWLARFFISAVFPF